VRFGDVVENVNDQPKRATLPLDTRYVAGEHVDENRLTIDRWGTLGDDLVPPTFKRRFQPGDVLFHSRNLKKIAVPDFGGITGEKLFVLRTCSPSLLQEFVPYVLLSPAFTAYAEASWSGSVNKFLNWTPLARYELDLPPVEAQRAIIAVASRAIAFAESATALALSAECLLQSALQELMPPGGAACRMARLLTAVENGGAGTVSRRSKMAAHSRAGLWAGRIGATAPITPPFRERHRSALRHGDLERDSP
jgi:type I restriction enzyme S subunit